MNPGAALRTTRWDDLAAAGGGRGDLRRAGIWGCGLPLAGPGRSSRSVRPPFSVGKRKSLFRRPDLIGSTGRPGRSSRPATGGGEPRPTVRRPADRGPAGSGPGGLAGRGRAGPDRSRVGLEKTRVESRCGAVASSYGHAPFPHPAHSNRKCGAQDSCRHTSSAAFPRAHNRGFGTAPVGGVVPTPSPERSTRRAIMRRFPTPAIPPRARSIPAVDSSRTRSGRA
jgi:hypothetical protein